MGTYLITGAAGFIANRVAGMLLEQGHKVVGVDNLNDAYDVRLKHWRLDRLTQQPNFRFHRGDIADCTVLEQVFEQSGPLDSVINLAARAGVRASVEDPWLFYQTNLTGTLNLLECCRRHGVPKFVQASTSSIYGGNAPLPTTEEADSSHPLQPYSASKKAAETLAYTYHFLYDLDVTVFRYFTVYGPAGRPDMSMFRFAQWIAEGRPLHLYGTGEQSRGFTYLDDIARGTILGLKPLGYEIINLGGHEVITINSMIAMMEEMLDQRAEIVHHPVNKAEMMTNWANVDKARRLLGWESRVGLQEGIRAVIDWYLAERSWASQVVTA